MPVRRTVPWRVRAAVQRDSCETCGSTSQLGLHHMDEDRTNNSPENLQTLCPRCHMAWHWDHGKNPWRRHDPTCLVCDKPSRHLGLCNTHWTRLRRHGSPYLRKIKRGSTWLWTADSGPRNGLEFREYPKASQTGWTELEASETRSSRKSRK